MASVRAVNTKPELAVRRLVHGLGYRYRLHGRRLPGKPDLVFPERWKVIFVHGCFWHRHKGCALARIPKSRSDFWRQKLEGNAKRDARNIRLLRGEGWGVMVVWECQIKKTARLTTRIRRILDA
jgi:DNA mismatch endonuclease (patch repair protein)